mgnify:CR=1 FL=1
MDCGLTTSSQLFNTVWPLSTLQISGVASGSVAMVSTLTTCSAETDNSPTCVAADRMRKRQYISSYSAHSIKMDDCGVGQPHRTAHQIPREGHSAPMAMGEPKLCKKKNQPTVEHQSKTTCSFSVASCPHHKIYTSTSNASRRAGGGVGLQRQQNGADQTWTPLDYILS